MHRLVQMPEYMVMICTVAVAEILTTALERWCQANDYWGGNEKSMNMVAVAKALNTANVAHKAIYGEDMDPELPKAMQALFVATILNTWSAFESMAGDLWETALNKHPKNLANLSGKELRIAKQAGFETDRGNEDAQVNDSNAGLKISDICRVTKGNFQIHEQMGTLLRSKYAFTKLIEIRAAYSEAFAKDAEKIDAALANTQLDELNALRNVFVHRAGIVDAEYLEKARKLPELPQASSNNQIELNGEIVREKVNPVIRCGVDLILAVDEWISLHPR